MPLPTVIFNIIVNCPTQICAHGPPYSCEWLPTLVILRIPQIPIFLSTTDCQGSLPFLLHLNEKKVWSPHNRF